MLRKVRFTQPFRQCYDDSMIMILLGSEPSLELLAYLA